MNSNDIFIFGVIRSVCATLDGLFQFISLDGPIWLWLCIGIFVTSKPIALSHRHCMVWRASATWRACERRKQTIYVMVNHWHPASAHGPKIRWNIYRTHRMYQFWYEQLNLLQCCTSWSSRKSNGIRPNQFRCSYKYHHLNFLLSNDMWRFQYATFIFMFAWVYWTAPHFTAQFSWGFRCRHHFST